MVSVVFETDAVELRVKVRTIVVGVGDAEPDETSDVIVVVIVVWFALVMVPFEGVDEGAEVERDEEES